jgi:hypothetical protein
LWPLQNNGKCVERRALRTFANIGPTQFTIPCSIAPLLTCTILKWTYFFMAY